MNFFRKFSIDLGTANTLVFDLENGMALEEPTAIAIDSENETILALGKEADQLRGRSSDKVTVHRPLQDGVIVSSDVAEMMLSRFMSQILGNRNFFRPKVIAGIPSGATDNERLALRDAVSLAGANLQYLIDEPVAAAIGAGLPVSDPVGSMVVDIGGGTSEVSVLSMAGVVISDSVDVAGDELTDAIRHYVKQKYHLLIGHRCSENIKHRLGTVYPNEALDTECMDVTGMSLLTSLPSSITLTGAEVREVITPSIRSILAMIRRSLECFPAELAADLSKSGMILVGGGALLKGLDRLISEEFDVKVNIPPEPMHCVVLGASEAMANPQKYSRLLQEIH